MKIISIAFLLLALSINPSFAVNFDTLSVREAYNKVSGVSGTQFVNVTFQDVKLIADSNLLSILPFYRLYECKIIDGTYMEVNHGIRPAIIAISKVYVNDIRFFFGGCSGKPSDFLEVFYQKPVKDISATSKSINNLFFKTYIWTAFNSVLKTNTIKQKSVIEADKVIVTTNWIETYTDIDTKETSDLKVEKKAIFYFKNGILANITCDDWNK